MVGSIRDDDISHGQVKGQRSKGKGEVKGPGVGQRSKAQVKRGGTGAGSSQLMACRVAGACDHAERTAKLEIGRSDSSARLPSSRSSCIESARTL
jgi:hypothetical protein